MATAKLTWEGARVHFGVVLSGEKVVDNPEFRAELLQHEPHAIGGEMEGTGLYAACNGRVDWILVKAICDWADGKKEVVRKARQLTAAANAAQFVLHALQFTPYRRAGAPSIGLDAQTTGKSSLPTQPFFFGREKELASIAEAILPESRTWGALIDGPGGIGKTALAVRAGHLAPAEQYPHKIFLSAKLRYLSPAGEKKLDDFMLPNYLALLSELAEELGDKDLAKSPENERANAVRRALTDQRVLIVIDNLETFEEPERDRLFQFLIRLPQGSKAIVTSRRRSDVDARVIRVDRLPQKDALDLLRELAMSNSRLAREEADWQALYEATGGNPLLLCWTAGQLGRKGSQCRTVAEACEYLKHAPPGNDPLEYIFGDLLGTFTESETAVLAALTHFTQPARVRWIADLAGLSEREAETALEDLADRALLVTDPASLVFFLPPLAAMFLRNKRPEAVTQTGDRLADSAYALVLENGYQKYERFPFLEAEWPLVAAAIPQLLQGENGRLQQLCRALDTFLDFSGRWDDQLLLAQQAEQKAVGSNDWYNAGLRPCMIGWVHYVRGQAAGVLDSVQRAETHWQKARAGAREQAFAMRLRGHGLRLEARYPAAMEAYRQALALDRGLTAESEDVAASLNDIAEAERLSGDYAAAERDCREALRIAKNMGHREGVATCTGNLAEIALDREDWSAAELLAREALLLAEGVGRQELIGAVSEHLARSLVRHGRPAEGLPHARRAVEIAARLKQAKYLALAQATLKDCEEKSGRA